MRGHTKSCSCTNCAYRSYSKRPSIQHLLEEGNRIDRLFYGKYLPLRERKLLEKLIKTRAVYDDVRDQLLLSSGSSDRARSEYTFKSQGDDSNAMSRTVSKLVSLVDRGQIQSSNAILSSCCSCCSCSSLKKIKRHMKKHPSTFTKPDVPYENIAKYKLRAEKRARSKRKRLGSKMRDVRFTSRTIYSEACLCTKSLVDMMKHSSKALKTRQPPKEEAEISYKSSTSQTDVKTKGKKKTSLKTRKNRKSTGSETPKPFPIKKDSIALYKDKMRRKHARRKARDKGLDSCDSESCKHIRYRLKKKRAKAQTICEPGICVPEECDPEKCLQINEAIQKKTPLEDWECEPGICVPDECDPEICYKRIIARRGGNMKKRKGRPKIAGSSKTDSSILAKPLSKTKTSTTETKKDKTKTTMPKILKTTEHTSSQSRSSHSVKYNQTEHMLKRCFCTLKLQKKKHNIKTTKSKKSMASLSVGMSDKIGRVRKTQTKSAGITYVVPPMGTPPRRLLPYECEPFFCTPGECDPYVCEKRIQARYRKDVAHDDGNQTIKKSMRMHTKGIKVHKPRIRYTRSQTIKTEKSKQTHTAPFLHRCFCTLKLFNKDKKKVGTVTSPRKLAKPPKTKIRDKYSETNVTTKSSYTNKSKGRISSESLQSKSHAIEKKLTRLVDHKMKIMPSPAKQAVRIGSSFSFNIEFYKEKNPIIDSQEMVEITKSRTKQIHNKPIDIHERKKPRKIAVKRRGSGQSHTDLNYKTMTSEVKVKEKGIFVKSATPACFCTLKLQKKGKNSKTHSYDTSKGTETTLELYGPRQNSEYKSTSTSKSQRYDPNNFCVPATCDPYESYEEMKRREIKRFHDRDIATEQKKRKSTLSMTSGGLSSKFKARSTQSYVTEHITNKVKHKKEFSRQSVRIGSNFSFNINFYKNHSASIARDTFEPNSNIIASDLTFKNKKNKMRRKDIRPAQKYVTDRRSQASSIISKEEKALNVSHKLKRCFCTLKLHQNNNLVKADNQDYRWFRPITTQFMQFRNQYIKQASESENLTPFTMHDKKHIQGPPCNKIVRHEKSILGLDLQHSCNLHSKCNLNVGIKEHNEIQASNSIKNVDLKSSINFNVDYGQARGSPSIFRQHNEYHVGYVLNSNETHMINNKFHRSYYALNLKVSQARQESVNITERCSPTNCKFYERFRPSKQIGTEGIKTRVGTSTTRQKTHKTAVATRVSKTQMINDKRERKKSKHYFDPGKRITNIGSSINYNLKFYKDTSSKIYSPERLSKVYPSSVSSNINNESTYKSMIRKCICSLSRNKQRGTISERSLDQRKNKRKVKTPYSKSVIRKSRATITDSVKLKRNRDECDPQECVRIKKKLLKGDQTQISAGDHLSNTSTKSRIMAFRKDQPIKKDRLKQEQYKHLLDECDSQECLKIMRKVMKKGHVQRSAGDFLNDTSRKERLMSNRHDREDKKNKLEQNKHSVNGCDPDECRKILAQMLNKGRAQISGGDSEYIPNQNKRKKSLQKEPNGSPNINKCDPNDCKRKLEQSDKKRRLQSSAGDHVMEGNGRSILKSIRTDRAKRLSRSKYTPEIPEDLQKIMIRPLKSDTIKYGSNLNINIEFFKDSISDLYPVSSSPDNMPRIQRLHSGLRRPRKSGQNGSPDFLQNRRSVRSIKAGPTNNEDYSPASHMFKRCFCSIKALKNGSRKMIDNDNSKDDHGDGPASEINKNMCKCKMKNHKCKCKKEKPVKKAKCKCKSQKQKNTCKCAKYAKQSCLCKTSYDDDKLNKKSIRFQDDIQESKQKSGDSVIRKCFCKLGVVQDRKSLQLKPSNPLIPAGAKGKRDTSRKAETYEERPYLSDQPTDMDTIMPYSKKKFRRQSSQSKLSKSPCNVCPENVCPECGRGDTHTQRIDVRNQMEVNNKFDVTKTRDKTETNPSKERKETIKPNEKKGNTISKLVKFDTKESKSSRKEWCIRKPSFNLKEIFGKFYKFGKEDETKEIHPLFEMIVDSHTMNVRNKDEIIQDLMSGRIFTADYNYNNMPQDDTAPLNRTTNQALENTGAPVMDFATTETTKKKIKSKNKSKGETAGEPPLAPGGAPFMLGGPQLTPGKFRKPPKPPKKSKVPPTRHPRGCKCCDCRREGKKNKKMKAKDAKQRRTARVKPCYCGTTVCKRESERMKQLLDLDSTQKNTIGKSCVCGSDVCKRQAKVEANDLKLFLEKKRAAERRKDLERRMRIEGYNKEDAMIRKRNKKRDKKAMKQILNTQKANDLVLLGESVLDVGRFGRTHTCGVLRSVARAASNPGDAWFRFKQGMKHPADAFNNISDIIFKHSGINRLGARIKARFSGMRSTKIVVAEMETHPVTNMIVHAGDKHKPRVKKSSSPPIDFNCSPFMGSLRQKPCLWIYYLCPWFYPHCIGCLGLWRQFTDILLFILAIGVWSPCILGMEILRGLMCCLVCTG